MAVYQWETSGYAGQSILVSQSLESTTLLLSLKAVGLTCIVVEILKIWMKGRSNVGIMVICIGSISVFILRNVKIAVFRNEELIPLGTGHTVDVLAQDKYVEGVLTREDALSMLQEKRIYNYLGRDGFKEIQFYDKPVRLQEGDVVSVFSNGMQEERDMERNGRLLSPEEKL